VIRRIVSVVAVAGLAALAFWMPREAPVAADTLGDLPPSVIFHATRGNATPPFVGRWELSFAEPPGAEQRLTLQIGPPTGGTAPGRLTSGPGDPSALLARIAEVLSNRPGADDLPPATALDLRLDLIAEHVSVGHGDVGATIVAGAFVSEPAGDWRVYRVMLGDNGPQCFLGISATEQAAVLLTRDIEDGPAIVARFRSLLARGPAPS
jgi:hypothetical protein